MKFAEMWNCLCFCCRATPPTNTPHGRTLYLVSGHVPATSPTPRSLWGNRTPLHSQNRCPALLAMLLCLLLLRCPLSLSRTKIIIKFAVAANINRQFLCRSPLACPSDPTPSRHTPTNSKKKKTASPAMATTTTATTTENRRRWQLFLMSAQPPNGA